MEAVYEDAVAPETVVGLNQQIQESTMRHPWPLHARWILLLSTLFTVLILHIGSPAEATDDQDLALSAGTDFTYQGSLRQGGRPAEGAFDLSFSLFDATLDGRTFGQIDLFDVPVRGGSFAVELDFLQPVFSGEKYWLETQVRVAGEGAYTRIGPRDLLLGKAGTTCAVDNDVLITGSLAINPGGGDTGLNIYCCNEADLDGGGQITLQSFSGGALRIDDDEIQATAFGTPQQFQINPHGGNIGLGVSNPAAPVHILGGPDATAGGGGALLVGLSTHLAIDQDEIQAHSGGAPSSFQVNPHGGNIGLGVSSPTAPVHLPGGPDVTASGGGALVIGASTHIAIDSNEIQAHAAGAPATLYLNNEGGIVRTGGDAVVGGSLGLGIQLVEVSAEAEYIEAHCPSGKRIISGGCTGGEAAYNRPVDSTTWGCFFPGDTTANEAVALCGRVTW